MNSDIEAYIESLLKHYELDRDALIQLWLENVPSNKTENPLLNLKLSELKEMCKAKGLPVSGTKQTIVERLTNSKVIKTENEGQDTSEMSETKVNEKKESKKEKEGKGVKRRRNPPLLISS
jgi:hypothetical protein